MDGGAVRDMQRKLEKLGKLRCRLGSIAITCERWVAVTSEKVQAFQSEEKKLEAQSELQQAYQDFNWAHEQLLRGIVAERAMASRIALATQNDAVLAAVAAHEATEDEQNAF